MKLSSEGIMDKSLWNEKGYSIPTYNREMVIDLTKKEPTWIHFGAGNIFRAFQSNVVERLLQSGKLGRGIIVVEGYDTEIIDVAYRKQDNLSILITLKGNGTVEKKVVGSVVESLKADPKEEVDFARLKEIFKKTSLQMVSFTITEKGYSLVDASGEFLGSVVEDFENGPKEPCSYIGKVATLLYERYLANKLPIAMVSMDNCSHNGTKLYDAIHKFATMWENQGLVTEGFLSYVEDKEKVSFPWSMIDKITPRPDDSVKKMLIDDGILGMEPVVTQKHTYVAPFVNAEESEYLVIEDWFPNGRPNLEEGGVIFTNRETVDQVEKMKVCTCLNPLHTALAVFGCLLSYTKISEEMKDKTLKKLVERIGYEEGMPVVVDPKIMNPRDFLKTVLEERIPNPFMPDTPQRIASDTSQKIAIRYGETIKAYLASKTLDVNNLICIPLVFAGWCRYLMGLDDQGNVFERSPDPRIPDICKFADAITFGEEVDAHKVLSEILSDETIFGVDLYEIGMAKKVEEYFTEMVSGKGAVKATLEKYV